MTSKKYCRPRMTIEARDAINKACEKLTEVCQEEKERSDLIIEVCDSMSKLSSCKKMRIMERDRKKWLLDAFKKEVQLNAKTRKILFYSAMLNIGLIAYMVFS